jgi:Asp-tRNA(Asn)/Glu-tRNA(Gln) amidotransferase B subunit
MENHWPTSWGCPYLGRPLDSEEDRSFGWFVGQVMKASGGKANPQAVNDLLKKKIGI